MPDRSAEILVTKLAAAQRQLCAAIRMYFSGEDDLAIHTIASAAYSILADLKQARGREEAGDYVLSAIFYAVRDFRRSTLPTYITSNRGTMQWIEELASKIPISAESSLKDFAVKLTDADIRDYWRWRNRAANFLKHADRDSRSALSTKDINNLELLTIALGAYVDLTDSILQPEGIVLWIYFCVQNGVSEGLPSQYAEMASVLEGAGPRQRLLFCNEWLSEWSAQIRAE